MRRALHLPSVLSLLLLAAPLGCSDGPARGFERFYEALAVGSPDALARMSERARTQLDAPARAALLTTPPRMSLKSVRVVQEEPNRAVLEVEDSLGAKERVIMVREGGAWRVDL